MARSAGADRSTRRRGVGRRIALLPADHTFWWDEDRRDGPLYAWPGLLTASFVGVPIGIGRAALEAAGPW